MNEYFNPKNLRIFNRFSEYGITQCEICSAIECLTRENNGRKPEFNAVVLWLVDYIQWRRMEQARKNGEVYCQAHLTDKGKKALELEKLVNQIFKPKGGENNGTKEERS